VGIRRFRGAPGKSDSVACEISHQGSSESFAFGAV
jgi:hypothetical protein